MSFGIVDIPDVPDRAGSDFDRAVREKLTSAQPVELPIYTAQQLNALTASIWRGHIVRCSNGDAGSECLAYCTGFNWKVIELGGNISLS